MFNWPACVALLSSGAIACGARRTGGYVQQVQPPPLRWKKNTRCELALRRELWRRGLRYRLHVPGLPGRPDIVFPGHRLVIFCDGDFWHGRDLDHRLKKLTRGHNAAYWTAKIQRNVERDQQNTRALTAMGWNVLRFWETEVLRETTKVADRIEVLLAATRTRSHRRAARSASIDDGGR